MICFCGYLFSLKKFKDNMLMRMLSRITYRKIKKLHLSICNRSQHLEILSQILQMPGHFALYQI